MKVRNIPEAKAELSLIDEVQKGNDVIIAKAGEPVARLVTLMWTSPSPDAGIDGRRNLDI